MSDSGGWSLACGHCARTLPEQSQGYQSPTCDTCHFHVHEECLDECNERLELPGGGGGWHFACGHCGERLPPQTPGKESPTCASCKFHIHLGCLDECAEDPSFDRLPDERQIVTSSKQVNTSEKRSLAQIYPVGYSALNGNYRKLIDGLGCIFIDDLSYLRLSCGDGLAWLNPYTGNQHNRCLFVQLALAALWRDSASVVFKNHFFEAFLGSGQVFLNFAWCGGLFDTTTARVVAGDLNVCLCAAWMGLVGQLSEQKAFLAGYLNRALRLDRLVAGNADIYDSVLVRLNVLLASGGELTGGDLVENYSEETLVEIAHLYIYLNNRCANQTSYNLGTGHFSATLDKAKQKRLDQIRTAEWNALCRVAQRVSPSSLVFRRADFAWTTAKAGLGDVVIYDCPFPKFSISTDPVKSDFNIVVKGNLTSWTRDVNQALSECSGNRRMEGGGHYGGDEGGDLQIRILRDAVGRQRAGASILICNYATPALLVWFSKLSYALYGTILPIFLFKRPQKGDELYFIAIWPSQRVLDKSGKTAKKYLTERIWQLYRAISDKMSGRHSLSGAEVKLLIDKGWK